MAGASTSQATGELPRALVVLLGLAASVVVVAGLRSAAGLVGPVFLALVVTIAAHPVHVGLARRLPSWLATVVCLLVVNLVLVGLVVTIVVATARFASLLPDYQAQFDDWVGDLTARLSDAGVSADMAHRVASSLDPSKLTGFIAAALGGVLSVLSSLFFVIALMLFMTVDGSQFPRHLGVAAVVRPQLVSALGVFAAGTRRYLVVSTVFGLIVAVLDTGALWLLGVPAPLLWGLVAFLTNYIPNVGFVIGLVPPAILALLEGGAGLMLGVILVYCVLNIVIQSIIQPKVVGDAVGLSTTLTFLSLVFWSWVIGPVGAILAIPMSLLVRAVLVDADPGSRWLAPLVANSDARPDGPDAAEQR